MNLEVMTILLIGGLFLFLALGMEIPVALGILSSVGLAFFVGLPQVQIAWTSWAYLNSAALMAMPLFVFMGTLLSNTGVIRGLFEGAEKWIGGVRGGLLHAVLVANAAFGAMSGSSVAAAATFSIIAYPEMEKRNYDAKLAFGTIAVGGTLSVLIPPSILLIVYGVWETLSVPHLFAAALLPGIILTAALMLTITILIALNPKKAPKAQAASWREKIFAIRSLLPWIGVIALVFACIFGGLTTATEAAAVGAAISLIIALAYHKLSYQAVKASFLSAVKISAMIGFVVLTAKMLSFVFQAGGLIDASRTFINGLPFGKYGILAIFCVMYLILGCFVDSFSMLVLTMPFVGPVIAGFGFSRIWWGVIYVILAEIGLVTPPFGLNLFVIQGIFPRYSIWTIALGTLPLLIPMLLTAVILIIFPDLTLWLPGLFFG